MSEMDVGSYMFLRGHNIKHDTFLYGNGEYIPLKEGEELSSKIYDNGDSQIYKRALDWNSTHNITNNTTNNITPT